MDDVFLLQKPMSFIAESLKGSVDWHATFLWFPFESLSDTNHCTCGHVSHAFGAEMKCHFLRAFRSRSLKLQEYMCHLVTYISSVKYRLIANSQSSQSWEVTAPQLHVTTARSRQAVLSSRGLCKFLRTASNRLPTSVVLSLLMALWSEMTLFHFLWPVV